MISRYLRITIFSVLIFFVQPFYSQRSFEKDYTPIKSTGTLPDVLVLNPQKKIKQDAKDIVQKDNKLRKEEESHNIHANYAIDKALHGGNIIVNDAITAYVNKVADKLLVNKPEIRKNLHLFVTKVPEVNAYSMGKGYVFVNIGLIAQVENEAQLALVLAHEISHDILRHSFNTYINSKKIDAERKIKSFDDRMLQFFAFSKENEFQADSLGLEIYKTSDYPLDQVVPVFDVMKYSYLPIDEVPFDSSFFNDQYYHIPVKYYLKELQQIKDKEDYNDKKSTHPNIAKRKERMAEMMEDLSIVKKEPFLVSRENFMTVRDISRFELCRLYMVERSYFSSIITAYIMLKKYPDNRYLHETVSKSLYAMALYKEGILKYSSESYRSGPIPDFTKTEGYSQQLNFLMDRIPQKDMVILSLKNSWKYHQRYPGDQFYSLQCDTLFSLLTRKHHAVISEFSDTAPGADYKTDDYYKYAFVDFLQNDPEFKKKFEQYSSTVSSQPQIALKAFTLPAKGSKSEKKTEPGENLGITKVLVIDPFYLKTDERVSETSIYTVTDSREKTLISLFKSNAAAKKIQVEFLDPDDLSPDAIQTYNDFSLINDWFNERMEGGEKQDSPPMNSDEIPDLIKKYGTKYAIWVGVFSASVKDGVVKNDYYTIYNSLLFDLETGRLVSEVYSVQQKNDSASRINDYVDDTFDAILEKNRN